MMARQEIDLTTPQPNGKMGEPTKSAWEKVNDMTEELYSSPGMLGQAPGKNMLINCGAPINQRAFAGGALAAGAYGYDRWKAGASGCNITINETTGVYTHTSGQLVQIILAPEFAWGTPLTFSVENPSSTLNVNIGGSSVTIPAGSGRVSATVTPAGSGNMTLQITATGATYSRPQLERGSAATGFDYRCRSGELIVCKGYYQIDTNGTNRNGTTRMNLGVGLVFSATRIDVNYRFEVGMISPPTVTISPGSSWRVLVGGGATSVTSMAVSEVSKNSAYISATVTGRTPGQAAIVQSQDALQSGIGIELSSEL